MICKYGDPTCPCQDGDPCHYEPHKATNTSAMHVPPEYALRAVAAEREACALVAEEHLGSASKDRLAKGQRLGKIVDDGLVVEIRAEERGEDIAAEIIARKIRERK